MSKPVNLVRVEDVYRLFQPHLLRPPTEKQPITWEFELLRERPDYYQDLYVEDAWGAYALRPTRQTIQVPPIPIELEVPIGADYQAVLTERLNAMATRLLEGIGDLRECGHFYPDGEDDRYGTELHRLAQEKTVFCTDHSHNRDGYAFYVREGVGVMTCMGQPSLTLGEEGKGILTWAVGFGILDSTGVGIAWKLPQRESE